MGSDFNPVPLTPKLPQVTWAISELHSLWSRKEELIELIANAKWVDTSQGVSMTVPTRVAMVIQTIVRLKNLDADISHMGYTEMPEGELLCYLRNHYADGYANIFIHAGEVECEIIRVDFYKTAKIITF